MIAGKIMKTRKKKETILETSNIFFTIRNNLYLRASESLDLKFHMCT